MINKEGWEIMKLGNCATFINGYPFKPTEWNESGLPIIRIQNLNNETAKFNYFAGKLSDNYLIRKGDILISWSASIGVYEWLNGDAYLNQHIFKVVFDKIEINKFYFKYLISMKIDEMIQSSHGVGMKHITKKDFDKISIELHPLPIQQQIVSELDTLTEIITKKKQQLAELDNLAQATFYDMFGDPVTNEKGWEVKKLKDVTMKIGSGATPKGGDESYKSEGISLVRSMNVYNGMFKYNKLAYIDELQAGLLKNVTVKKDDVLINITGASVARSCIVPEDILPARVNQHVSILRVDNSILSSTFLNSMLISSTYQDLLINISRVNAATRESITKSQLESLLIIIPPLELQTQFSDKINAIEKQKELIEKSINDTQLLFDYSMDKYFN